MFLSKSSKTYSAAQTSNEDADLVEKTELLTEEPDSTNSSEKDWPRGSPRSSAKQFFYRFFWPLVFTIVNLTILGISLFTLHRGFRLSRDIRDNVNNELLKQTSHYSPLLDSISVRYHDVQFNGSLFPPKSGASIYRQPPSPEVDAAWEYISDTGPFVVSKEAIRRIGKDPAQAVKIPASWGLGHDVYFAQADGLHQIHCLNVLRKAAYTNRPYYANATANMTTSHSHSHTHTSPRRKKALEEAHIAHCTYTLLQTLMCNVNYDIVTYNWVQGQIQPYPDFGVTHKCRDFDALIGWYYENRIEFDAERYPEREAVRRPTKGEKFIDLESPDEDAPED